MIIAATTLAAASARTFGYFIYPGTRRISEWVPGFRVVRLQHTPNDVT